MAYYAILPSVMTSYDSSISNMNRSRGNSGNIIRRHPVAALGAAALIGLMGASELKSLSEGPKYPSLDSKAAIKKAIGHVPAGIKSIRSTDEADLKRVDYIAELTEAGIPLESSIAEDMHLIAPNQDQTAADDAIDTYLPAADRASHTVRTGEEFQFVVNTKTGEILPKSSSVQK